MKTYTVTVSWLVAGKNDYLPRSRMIRGIHADDIIEAGEIAMAKIGDVICPSVSMIWADWPQLGEAA